MRYAEAGSTPSTTPHTYAELAMASGPYRGAATAYAQALREQLACRTNADESAWRWVREMQYVLTQDVLDTIVRRAEQIAARTGRTLCWQTLETARAIETRTWARNSEALLSKTFDTETRDARGDARD